MSQQREGASGVYGALRRTVDVLKEKPCIKLFVLDDLPAIAARRSDCLLFETGSILTSKAPYCRVCGYSRFGQRLRGACA